MQGGMCALPMPPFPTGVMRGRFHPTDGQLYACGMFAWAGNQTQPGGFYRVRYTGKPMFVPIGLHARRNGLAITFTGPLDRKTAGDPAHYAVKTWSLKRTVNYGSDHYRRTAGPDHQRRRSPTTAGPCSSRSPTCGRPGAWRSPTRSAARAASPSRA